MDFFPVVYRLGLTSGRHQEEMGGKDKKSECFFSMLAAMV